MLTRLSVKCAILALCICLVIFGTSPQSRAEDTLTPLSEYIPKNDLNDSGTVLYVYDRCQAMFMALVISTKNSNNPTSDTFVANARNAYQQLAMAAAQVMLKSTKDPNAALTEHTDIIKKLLARYQNHIEELYLSGGDFEKDKLVGQDMLICAAIWHKVKP